MTLLAPLQPIVDDVLGIESFTSYLRRLASIYNAKLSLMIRYLCESSEVSQLVDAPPFRAVTHAPRMLSAYGDIVRSLVERTEAATGVQRLGSTTLLHLEPALSRNGMGALSPSRRFCPDCVLSMQANISNTIAEPLLWSLSPITCCPIHCRMLAVAASEWNRSLEDGQPGMPLFSRWDSYESWRIAEAMKLLTYSDDHPKQLAQVNAPLQFLRAFMRYRHLQLSDLVELTECPYGNLQRQLEGALRMSLKTIFAFAQKLALSPVDILFDPEAAAVPMSLFDEGTHAREVAAHVPRTSRPRRPRTVLAEMQLRLKALLDSTTPLPPFKSVCLSAGVSTGYVRHRLPTASAAYRKRRIRECAHRRACRRKEAEAHAWQFVATKGIPPNLRQTGRNLRDETGLSKSLIERALRSAVKRSRMTPRVTRRIRG